MKITVVGAGVIGCAIAHELACRGARVHVLDARGVGQGATQASAGMLAPYIEGHNPALLDLGLRSLALYDRFIARLADETASPVEYGRAGTLQTALSDADVDQLTVTARHLDASGGRYTWFDGRDARRAEPGLAEHVVRALLIPSHGYVVASALTTALADASRRREVEFSFGRVLHITEHHARIEVDTTHGRVESDAVVLAAGSWSSRIAPDAVPTTPSLVTPVRGQLLHLRATAPVASCVIWRGSTYLVPWRDGSVLVGATVEDVGFDESVTADGLRHLRESAAEVLPALAQALVEEVRAGLRPMTPDGLPVMGPSSTMRNVFYATGHYRSGVLLAPLTAALLADLVLDGRAGVELAHVRPDRLGL